MGGYPRGYTGLGIAHGVIGGNFYPEDAWTVAIALHIGTIFAYDCEQANAIVPMGIEDQVFDMLTEGH